MLMILSSHNTIVVAVNIAELHVSIVKNQVIKRLFQSLKRYMYHRTMSYHDNIN